MFLCWLVFAAVAVLSALRAADLIRSSISSVGRTWARRVSHAYKARAAASRGGRASHHNTFCFCFFFLCFHSTTSMQHILTRPLPTPLTQTSSIYFFVCVVFFVVNKLLCYLVQCLPFLLQSYSQTVTLLIWHFSRADATNCTKKKT